MGVKNMENLVYLHMNLAYEQSLSSKHQSSNLKGLKQFIENSNKPTKHSLVSQGDQNFTRGLLTINL